MSRVISLHDALDSGRVIAIQDDRTRARRLRRHLERLGCHLTTKGRSYEIHQDGTTLASDLSIDAAEIWADNVATKLRSDLIRPERAIVSVDPSVDVNLGDAVSVLRDLPGGTFQTCVTSPPYFQHRDYGVNGQIGQEATPDEYVSRLVAVFDEVRRTLRDDGTLWLNLGDSYVSNPSTSKIPRQQQGNGSGAFRIPDQRHIEARRGQPNRATALIRAGLAMKNLIGIPWRVAFALQARGWIIRSAIAWEKPAAMPEHARDRPQQSYETVLMLSRSSRYLYNRAEGEDRNIWRIPVGRLPAQFRGQHHAVMPIALAERCIAAGSDAGDHILDPFAGSGTTAVAAKSMSRHATVIDINPDYVQLIRDRLT
jgi:DNA modification methylase